jgi:hypothetical protein
VCLLHDNALPFTAEKNDKLMEKFGWKNPWPSPLQSWPGAFRFPSFPHNEGAWGGKRLATDEEVKEKYLNHNGD